MNDPKTNFRSPIEFKAAAAIGAVNIKHSKFYIKTAKIPEMLEIVVRWIFSVLPSTPTNYNDVGNKYNKAKIIAQILESDHCNLKIINLIRICKDKHCRANLALAKAAVAPREVVFLLAYDKIAFVRKTLAMRLDLPLALIEKLAQDSSGVVREQIALNIKTPMPILKILAKGDQSQLVRQYATNTLKNKKRFFMVYEFEQVVKQCREYPETFSIDDISEDD